jgi:hypothetical protein
MTRSGLFDSLPWFTAAMPEAVRMAVFFQPFLTPAKGENEAAHDQLP